MNFSPSPADKGPRTRSNWVGASRLVFWPTAAALTILVAACLQEEMTWPAVKRLIRERFPEVSQVSTTELSEWLNTPGSAPPLLLDARTPEEWAVSHLPGALLATTEGQALVELQGVEKEHLIVVYCSVGYRSAALAQQLISRGFTNVHNLEGSIFAWANEGRPVYQGERTVRQVHPYNKVWGQLLNRELWAPTPELSD